MRIRQKTRKTGKTGGAKIGETLGKGKMLKNGEKQRKKWGKNIGKSLQNR